MFYSWAARPWDAPMDYLHCPTCRNDFAIAPGERKPPWCPRCGADFRMPTAQPRPQTAAPTEVPPEVELTTAEAERPAERHVTREELLEGKTYQRAMASMGESRTDIPFYTWLFAGACLLAALGGGLVILFGIGGAVACVKVGMSKSEDRFGKLMACGGITIVCWVVSALATAMWITRVAAP
jgi:hypothetical protein